MKLKTSSYQIAYRESGKSWIANDLYFFAVSI